MGAEDPVTRRLEQARSSVAREMAQLADRLEEEVRGYDSPDLRDTRGLISRLEEMLDELGDRIERRINVSDERLESAIGGQVGRVEGVLHSVVESFTKAVHPFSRGENGAELGVEGEKRERQLGGRVRDAEQRLNEVLQRIGSVEDQLDSL